MARKPNYGQQRADVNRAKQAKKEAKLREREEAVAKRKAGGLDAEPEFDAEKTEDQEPARD